MNEQLISSETVKLAKKKGFDIKSYIKIGLLNQPSNWHKEQLNTSELWYFNITQSLLQKWLREEHKIDVSVIYFDKGYLYSVEKRPHKSNHYKVDYFDTFEEAKEKGLQEALKLI